MSDANTVVPLLIQILNVVLLMSWIILAGTALLMIRRRRIPDLGQVLWVIVIVFVPILGALAFFIARPGEPARP